MIEIVKNKKVPKDFLEFLDGTDNLKLITTSPMFGFISLREVLNEERHAFADRTLEIGYVNIDSIPFLVLNFDNIINFDTVVENLEAAQKEENALNLLLVENNGFIVLETRTLGLDPRIIEALIKDTKNINYSGNELTLKLNEIRQKYSTLELLSLATIKQTFKK